MGIGVIQFELESDTGCEFSDTHGGCTVSMWDYYKDCDVTMDLTVTDCIKLRNYLNVYIERYINIIEELK